MIFIIGFLIFLNIWAFITKSSVTFLLILLGLSIGLFRGVRAEKFSDVFNFNNFKYTLKSKENKLELVGAFLASLLIFQQDFFLDKFYILNFIIFIAFALFIYRFLFLNLSNFFK